MARLRTTDSRRLTNQAVLEAIHAFNSSEGYAPSYRDLALIVGTSHSNVWYAVEQLRKAGHVTRRLGSGYARALTLTNEGKRVAAPKV